MPVQSVVASASKKGKPFCEDAAKVCRDGDAFAAVVVDAHASREAEGLPSVTFAEYLSDQLLSVFRNVNRQSLEHAFDRVAAELALGAFDPGVGAIAGGVCLDETSDELVFAYVGDVRLYVNTRAGNQYRSFGQDHTPDHPEEVERLRPLLATGKFAIRTHTLGTTSWNAAGLSRLHYVADGKPSRAHLMVTRGFGNPAFQPAFSHEPTVQTVRLTAGLEHAVFALCSDGARRNVGRTFARFEREGMSHVLDAFAETFLRLHQKESDDDATAIFFRRTPA